MKKVAGWVFPLLVVAACGDDGSGGGGGAIPEGYVRLASEGQTDEVSEGVARFYDFADGSRLSIAIERGASCDGARIPEPGELTLSIFVPEALATDGKHSIRLDTAHVTAAQADPPPQPGKRVASESPTRMAAGAMGNRNIGFLLEGFETQGRGLHPRSHARRSSRGKPSRHPSPRGRRRIRHPNAGQVDQKRSTGAEASNFP